jgi:hypothetical protein
MLNAFVMRGGPQDGVRLDPAVKGPHPDTLFKIAFDDDEHQYARVGEQVVDDDGTSREVFQFDPTGSLVAAVRDRFARLKQRDDSKS